MYIYRVAPIPRDLLARLLVGHGVFTLREDETIDDEVRIHGLLLSQVLGAIVTLQFVMRCMMG